MFQKGIISWHGGMEMRTLIPALGFVLTAFLAAPPARAEMIAPADAKAHVGQTVTVEAAVSDVHTGRSGVTFIDIGGRYPDNAFTAVIFAGDLAKFPNAGALDGKTVAISGPVQLYQGRPEIILKSPDQFHAK
jgi:DNA/RNA endonuclease YhcR with UshA esterase domain